MGSRNYFVRYIPQDIFCSKCIWEDTSKFHLSKPGFYGGLLNLCVYVFLRLLSVYLLFILVAKMVIATLKYFQVKNILMPLFMMWGFDHLFVSMLKKT